MQRLAAAALMTNACRHSCASSSYMVVDPMPIPGRPPGVARSIHAVASFSGPRVVLEVGDPVGATYANHAITGGRIVSVTKPSSGGLRFEIEPDPARGALYVQIDVDLDDADTDAGASVEAAVSWGTSGDGGRAIAVVMNDR
jgi:hypothetical protein